MSQEKKGYCGKHGVGWCECLEIFETLQPEIDDLFNEKAPTKD